MLSIKKYRIRNLQIIRKKIRRSLILRHIPRSISRNDWELIHFLGSLKNDDSSNGLLIFLDQPTLLIGRIGVKGPERLFLIRTYPHMSIRTEYRSCTSIRLFMKISILGHMSYRLILYLYELKSELCLVYPL